MKQYIPGNPSCGSYVRLGFTCIFFPYAFVVSTISVAQLYLLLYVARCHWEKHVGILSECFFHFSFFKLWIHWYYALYVLYCHWWAILWSESMVCGCIYQLPCMCGAPKKTLVLDLTTSNEIRFCFPAMCAQPVNEPVRNEKDLVFLSRHFAQKLVAHDKTGLF